MGPKALNFIHSFARKSLTKGQGSGITKIPGRMEAEAKASEIASALVDAGLDFNKMDDFIKSEADVAKYLNILEAAKKERMKPIPADSPRGREITEQLFGKRGEVVDMKGNVIPEGSGIMGGESIESLIKSGDVTKGTVKKKSKKVTDRDMFRTANERLGKPKTDVNTIIKNINRLDPIEAMKEANKLLKREDYYKNMSAADAKRILNETEDHIFQRNVTPKETDVPMEETADEVTKAYIDAVRKGKFKGTEDQFRDMIDKMMDEDFARGGRVGLKGGSDVPVITIDDKIDEMISFYQDYLKKGGKMDFKTFSKKYIPENFAVGGRVGLKDGPPDPSRRNFLKILGGLAALPIVGKFFKPVKVGKAVTKIPVVKTADVAGKPEWFDALVNKVILEGDDVTKNFATKDRELVYTKKIDADNEVTVYRDLDTDSIRVDYSSPNVMLDEPVSLSYTKGQADEATQGMKPADEFETFEQGLAGRSNGPDDYTIDPEPNIGKNISDLETDVSKLKEYATGKGPTMKEFIASKKRKEKVKKINEGDIGETSDYVTKRQGDYYDYDDYASGGRVGLSSGGLAYLLGE